MIAISIWKSITWVGHDEICCTRDNMYKLYRNCLFYVYTDAHVIIYGQVFILQKHRVIGGLCESRSPRCVMMTAKCLLGNQVDVINADTLESLWIVNQYSWHHGIL